MCGGVIWNHKGRSCMRLSMNENIRRRRQMYVVYGICVFTCYLISWEERRKEGIKRLSKTDLGFGGQSLSQEEKKRGGG